jgi:cytochrome P450
MPTILYLLLAPLLLWLTHRTITLLQNYTIARRLRLPILLTPLSWQDPWWLPLSSLFQPLSPYFPFLSYSRLGWSLQDRYRMHHKYGPAFIIVSPRKTEIFIADPAAGRELLGNWRKWIKAPELYKIFTVFGEAVGTVNGEDWSRHRKVTAYGFSEKNCKLVWEEAVRQAEGMGAAWVEKGSKGVLIEEVNSNAATLAMHVLSYAAFGKRHDFGDEGVRKVERGHKMSHAEALREILHNLMFVILFDALRSLPEWLLPSKLRHLKLAKTEFKRYMVETVEEEREAVRRGDEGNRANLGAVLVAANEREKEVETRDVYGGKVRRTLSDDELYGNLFFFAVAGHETTSGAISFALPLLAANPDVQEWVHEEVDKVARDGYEVYNETYPKLVRSLAVMVSLILLSFLIPSPVHVLIISAATIRSTPEILFSPPLLLKPTRRRGISGCVSGGSTRVSSPTHASDSAAPCRLSERL